MFYLNKWLSPIENIAKSKDQKHIAKIFVPVLSWMYNHNYHGACHDTSAAMYIVLSELNLNVTLCIGEVKTGDQYFDHSWIEVGGLIYDVAVCLPLPGQPAFPPVFASINLETKKEPTLLYGMTSPVGLDDIAQKTALITLGEYANNTPFDAINLWDLVKIFGKSAGLKINKEVVRQKYSCSKRSVR